MLKVAIIGLLAAESLMARTAAPTPTLSPSPAKEGQAAPSETKEMYSPVSGQTAGNAAQSAPQSSPSAMPQASPATTAQPSSATNPQTSPAAAPEASPAAKPQAPPAVRPGAQSKAGSKETASKEPALPPTTAVITIHGVCEPRKTAAVGPTAKTACTTKITKAEFDKLVNMVVQPNQPQPPGLRRNLAQRYVELLAIANAAQKAGVQNSPEFALLRLRALAEAYQRELDQKYRNPPAAEVEAYYKQHQDDFEDVTLRRIYVPKNDPAGKGTPEEKAAFTKKASALADELRERAAKGEDLDTLQKEAYTKLGLASSPPTTQVGPVRKGALPPATEKELFALNAGGVTKVDEPTASVIYKVEKKQTLPMETVKDEIARTLHRQKMEARLKEITASAKADYNDTYFGPPAPPPAPVPPGDKR